MCCHDTGLVGGDITPPNDTPYKFCLCPRGKDLQLNFPNSADESNAVRDKLLKTGAK
jgi:hypothetical protein